MNNKSLGTEWEREVVEILRHNGYWAHFLTPDQRGAQPFDIIAVRDGHAIAIECKTLSPKQRYFSVDRFEDNQIMAFQKWKRCGNTSVLIALKWGEQWDFIPFDEIASAGKLDMLGRF